ncbi:MAG: glycerophosphoryl diester phosphodiesterase membrane domain-containing protein [Chitinophagales bacterium]
MFEEVLSETFSVFFKNIGRYTVVVLLIMLPFLAVMYGLQVATFGPDYLSNQAQMGSVFKSLGDPNAMGEYNQPQKIPLFPPQKMWRFCLGFLVLGLIGLVDPIAKVLVTDDAYKFKEFKVGELMGRAFRKLPGIIGIGIIMGIACSVGSILLIIPGLILLVKFSLALPIYVMEDTSAFKAISRSFELTRGKGWAIFFISLILIVFGYMINFIFGMLNLVLIMLLPNIGALITSQTISYIAMELATSMVIIAVYLFYAKSVGLIPMKGKAEPDWEAPKALDGM